MEEEKADDYREKGMKEWKYWRTKAWRHLGKMSEVTTRVVVGGALTFPIN